MNDKRTCGECKHGPSRPRRAEICLGPRPQWITLIKRVRPSDDATHCETFKPKIKGEE